MARSNNPLQAPGVNLVANQTGAVVGAPETNAALQLANSLAGLNPEVKGITSAIAAEGQARAQARAKADVLSAGGMKLADAVREGKLQKTQNPWYMQAYARESAAVRSQEALSALTVESQSWETRNDPKAFAAQWREEVGKLSEGFEGIDEVAGFAPVEAQFTQQNLQSNLSTNVKRIETERFNNISTLSAQAIADGARQGGGTLTPGSAHALLMPAYQQWIATGGSQGDWQGIAEQAIYTAARTTRNAGLIELLKAPELLGGVDFTNIDAPETAFGDGPDEASEPVEHKPSVAPAPAPKKGKPPMRSTVWPATGRITTEFGKVRKGGEVHRAIDIALPEGTPIRATGPGVIESTDIAGKGNSGKFARIAHGGKIVSGFAHLSQVLVEPGQHVNQGDIIGYSGSTGKSTGPHLHWRVTKNGVDVDPRAVTFVDQGDTQEAVAAGPGFQGGDKPFHAEVQKVDPNTLSHGPTLYEMPGVAARAEAQANAVRSMADQEQGDRLRALTTDRKVRGQEAADKVWEKYGTAILTGDYDTNRIITELSSQGYSAPVISEALGVLRSSAQDSAGLMSAKVALAGADPGNAAHHVDLFLEGARNGYSEDYEHRVSQQVAAGLISDSDGIRMVDNALARTRQLEADDRRPTPGAKNGIKNATAYNQGTKALSALFRQGAMKIYAGTRFGADTVDADYIKGIEAEIKQAGLVYLAAHPGDFQGAYAEAQARTNQMLNNLIARRGGQAARPSASPSKPAPAGANPRR